VAKSGCHSHATRATRLIRNGGSLLWNAKLVAAKALTVCSPPFCLEPSLPTCSLCYPAGIPATPRCGPQVGSVTLRAINTFAGISVLYILALAADACSFRTKYCCPGSGLDRPSRGRPCRLAPAAMQAACCRFVSPALYLCEAAARRARFCRCAGVRWSFGLTQRRRHCLLPGNG
jgi:hypothetical protein